MVVVERIGAAEREADAVDADRVMVSYTLEMHVRRSTGRHVIFGMDFDEAKIGPAVDQIVVMRGLEADPHRRSCRRWGCLYARSCGCDVEHAGLSSAGRG